MREGSSEWWGREECEGYLATLTWVWIVLRGNEVPCHGKCLWSRRLWVLLTPRSKRTMEDALQRLADRLAGGENALMQERTARPNAEADLQSLRAQVTPTSVPPAVGHNALADSVARAVFAAQSASRTEPLDSRAFSKLDKFRWERSRWHDWAAVLQSHISTAVTPNVAVINPDSVARGKSLHFMLTTLVEGPPLLTSSWTVDRVKSRILAATGSGIRSSSPGACSRLYGGNSLTSFHVGFELVRSFRCKGLNARAQHVKGH